MFWTQIIMKVVESVFSSSHRSCFFMKHFWHEFFMFKHAHCFPFIMICNHLKWYTTNDVHFIMCALIMWKETIERIMWTKIRKMYYFSQCSYAFFWVKNYFDIFYNLVMCIKSLLYNISHMISTHLYLYKLALNDMGILFYF